MATVYLIAIESDDFCRNIYGKLQKKCIEPVVLGTSIALRIVRKATKRGIIKDSERPSKKRTVSQSMIWLLARKSRLKNPVVVQ